LSGKTGQLGKNGVVAAHNNAESDKGVFSEFGEVKDLVVAYAKQETIEPIKGLGRFLAFGMAGSFLLSIGLLLLLLAGLRALQTETGTTFAGNWSWAPYLIVLTVAASLAGLTLSRIGGKK
jgi:hypothetical protein